MQLSGLTRVGPRPSCRTRQQGPSPCSEWAGVWGRPLVWYGLGWGRYGMQWVCEGGAAALLFNPDPTRLSHSLPCPSSFPGLGHWHEPRAAGVQPGHHCPLHSFLDPFLPAALLSPSSPPLSLPTVRDSGIGMSCEQLVSNLGIIARSTHSWIPSSPLPC